MRPRSTPHISLCLLLSLCLAACQGREAEPPAPPAATRAAPTATAQASGDAAAIQQVFTDFQQAVATNDDRTALALVASTTIQAYDEIRRLALLPSIGGQSSATSLGQRLMAAMLLHHLGEDRLQAMGAPEIFAYGIRHGWIGKETFARASLGAITVEGDTAWAPLIMPGSDETAAWSFRREGEQWTLDLTLLMRLADRSIQQAARQRGMSNDEAFLLLLQEALLPPGTVPWPLFVAEDASFSVLLPETPQRIDHSDHSGHLVHYLAHSPTAGHLLVARSQLDWEKADATTVIENATQGLIVGADADLSDIRDLQRGDRWVRQMTITLADGRRGMGRFIIDGDSLYQLLAIAPSAQLNLAKTQWDFFFASFALQGTPPPATD